MSKNDLRTFSLEIPINDEKAMDEFQKMMDEIHDATTGYIQNLMTELNISQACAFDVYYLRTRSRWSESNEQELIRLHSIGNPPNIYEWP
jgi:hypothetical protein